MKTMIRELAKGSVLPTIFSSLAHHHPPPSVGHSGLLLLHSRLTAVYSARNCTERNVTTSTTTATISYATPHNDQANAVSYNAGERLLLFLSLLRGRKLRRIGITTNSGSYEPASTPMFITPSDYWRVPFHRFHQFV